MLKIELNEIINYVYDNHLAPIIFLGIFWILHFLNNFV